MLSVNTRLLIDVIDLGGSILKLNIYVKVFASIEVFASSFNAVTPKSDPGIFASKEY